MVVSSIGLHLTTPRQVKAAPFLTNILPQIIYNLNFASPKAEILHSFPSPSLGSNGAYKLNIFKIYFCVLPYFQEMIQKESTVGGRWENKLQMAVSRNDSVRVQRWSEARGRPILHCDSIHDCLPFRLRHQNKIAWRLVKEEKKDLTSVSSAERVKTF